MENSKFECDLINDENIEVKKIKYIGYIKSTYIIKNIFSFINRKKRMKLIIYNKQLQNMIGIDIEDYKETSRKDIIEVNGKGREYKLNTNELIFEGEYKNWKKKWKR